MFHGTISHILMIKLTKGLYFSHCKLHLNVRRSSIHVTYFLPVSLNEFQYLHRSLPNSRAEWRILSQGLHECRRNYVNPFTFMSEFWRTKPNRDLKAVACQQVQNTRLELHFQTFRALAVSRGFLASAIPVVTYEILEVSAHKSAGNARLTWVACRARSPLALTSTYSFAPRNNAAMNPRRDHISRCDITCQGKTILGTISTSSEKKKAHLHSVYSKKGTI